MAIGSGDERPPGFSTWTDPALEDVGARRRGPRAVVVIAFGAAVAVGVITNAGHHAPRARLSTGISLQPLPVGPVSSADLIPGLAYQAKRPAATRSANGGVVGHPGGIAPPYVANHVKAVPCTTATPSASRSSVTKSSSVASFLPVDAVLPMVPAQDG